MAIKSNDKIEASDIQDLKTALSILFSNRSLSITDINRAGTSITQNLSNTLKTNIDNLSINQNGIITKDDLMLLLNYCLIINDIPNLTDQAQFENIFQEGKSSSLFNWLTDTICNATKESDAHGCRGACVGICSGGCHSNASGANGSSDKGGIYNSSLKGNSNTSDGEDWSTGANCTAASCQAICSGCYTSCSGTCDGGCNKCSSSCSSNCSKRCSGSCDTTCGGCSGTCGKTCEGCGSTCKEGCSGGCSSGCQTTCKDGCAWNCKNGCYGSTTGGTYT